jgi:glycosyltransferase involved in cell wall biosynthesis
MATVTIGIPVYNEEMFLRETITSAIRQKFEDLEIVISDNSSEDKSWEIIQEFACRDHRVKAIRQTVNIGPVDNFKLCLEKAKTKYFVWLGAHDLFSEDYIGNAVKFLEENHEYVMFYPKSRLVDGNENLLGYKDSDIDTAGLSVSKRMEKIANNLSWCTCFHGVFKTDILRQLPMKNIRGADHLLLFAAGVFGHIHFADSLGILRREYRSETEIQIDERRKKVGVWSEPRNKNYNSWAVLSMEHILYVLKSSEFPISKKILLVLSVANVFRKRFKVRILDNYRAYADRKK